MRLSHSVVSRSFPRTNAVGRGRRAQSKAMPRIHRANTVSEESSAMSFRVSPGFSSVVKNSSPIQMKPILIPSARRTVASRQHRKMIPRLRVPLAPFLVLYLRPWMNTQIRLYPSRSIVPRSLDSTLPILTLSLRRYRLRKTILVLGLLKPQPVFRQLDSFPTHSTREAAAR